MTVRREVADPHSRHTEHQTYESLTSVHSFGSHNSQIWQGTPIRFGAVAPGTRQISIGQPTDAQPLIELSQQGKVPMGRQCLVHPFQEKMSG
jgi:hypothetical protein